MQKTRFSQKLSNLVSCNWAFQRTHYWIPKVQDGWDPPSWKSTWRHFFCRWWSDLDKISDTGAEWHVDCGDVWKSKPDVKFQYGGHLGEFNGMSSQSHVSHCRVLPLGEFTVTIPEPHATLQGAVTWRNQCHDRVTLQGVRIPSAILKIVFGHILFFLFLMQFRFWRAAAFVSSPIHLLFFLCLCTWCRSDDCKHDFGKKALSDFNETWGVIGITFGGHGVTAP